MGALFIIPVLGISAWIIFTAIRHLQRGEVSLVWRSRFKVLLVIGVLLGAFFSFMKTSQPTAFVAIEGFPVPTSIHRLENDVWKKNDLPFLVKIAAHLADFAFGVAIGMLPLKIVGLLNSVKQKDNSPDEVR